MTPSNFVNAVLHSWIFVNPPFISINKLGFCFFNFSTISYLSGGIVLFSFGLKPCKIAFLAWTINLSAPAALISLTKLFNISNLSFESTPILCLIVIGRSQFFLSDSMHFATLWGEFISDAPKFPELTLGLGQPTLKFISSYPHSWANFAASLRNFGSSPPNWIDIGCSSILKSKNFSFFSLK